MHVLSSWCFSLSIVNLNKSSMSSLPQTPLPILLSIDIQSINLITKGPCRRQSELIKQVLCLFFFFHPLLLLSFLWPAAYITHLVLGAVIETFLGRPVQEASPFLEVFRSDLVGFHSFCSSCPPLPFKLWPKQRITGALWGSLDW